MNAACKSLKGLSALLQISIEMKVITLTERKEVIVYLITNEYLKVLYGNLNLTSKVPLPSILHI